MPRQRQPDLIRKAYYDAIVRHAVVPARAAAKVVQAEVLRLLTDQRRAEGKTDSERIKVLQDAGGRDETAKELIRRAGRRALDQLHPKALEAIAAQFGKRTTDFQREQLDKQVRQAIGVPLASIEKPIRDLVPTFAKANTELIRTVPERYFDRMAKDVQEAFATGMHPSTLAERFEELDDMAENDARRLARDQIGKLNAAVNQERQESLGITSYIWRTDRDARVRDNHAELDGEQFDWDDPPMGGGTDEDEEGNPGEGIMCRCYADPVLDDIVADVSAD